MIDLEHELLVITLMLYNNPLIPRNVVQLVIATFLGFINHSYMPFIVQHMKVHKSYSLEIDECRKKAMESARMISEKFKTEHRRFSYYEQKQLMIKLKEFKIGSNGNAVYIPLQ